MPDAGWIFAGWSGDLSGSDNPATLTVSGHMAVSASFSDNTQSGAVDVQVAESMDDVEERIDTGSVADKGVDLELGEDSAAQIVGLRFQNVQIPHGTFITSAYVEFSADEIHSGATSLTFHAQASDDAAPFHDGDYHVSNLPKTTAAAAWNNVAPWTTIHKAYQSSDLSPIIQEVVNRSGWSSGNALAIFVTGSGKRTAESYNGEPTMAPRLHVEYGGGQQTCYTLATPVAPSGSAGSVGADPDPDCAGTLYSEGLQVQLTAVANPGWTFAGWSGDLSGSDNPALVTMDGDKTAIASFDQDEYALTISTEGSGTVTKDPDQTIYHYGDLVQLTATPDAGWTFASWSGDLSGSDNPATFVIGGNQSVTAAFAQGGYTLTVNLLGGGTVSQDPDQASYPPGTQLQITAIPDPGWSFGGWSGDLSGSENPATLIMDTDRNVSASFTQDEYILTANASGSGAVGKDPDQATYHYGDQVQLTAEPSLGWTFSGWSGDLSGSDNPASLTIDGDKGVTASFSEGGQAMVLDVQVTASDDDAEERIDRNSVAVKGVDLELGEDRAPQIVGLRFQNLQIPPGAAITRAYIEFTADETHSDPTSLTFRAQASDDAAAFSSSEGDLSSRPETDAYVTWNNVEPWTTVHDNHQSADLSAVIQEVVNRSGWSAGNALAILITGSGRRTAESYNGAASLAPRLHVEYGGGQNCYNLNTSIDPVGGGTANTTPVPNCAGTKYTDGTQVQITGQANPGWTFNGWTGDLAGSANPATLTMDGDRSVTAAFSQEEYTLTANTTGSGAVTRDPDQASYHQGDQVQLTAVPADGWTFTGWSGDLSGSGNPAVLTIDGDMTVTASFSEGGQTGSVDVQVAASNDDAEERLDRFSVALKGVDLELGEDRAPQIVGLRFQNVTVPQGATITNAYVEFTADEAHTGATDLAFHAQASDDAAAFASSDGDLSSRLKTAASAAWNDVTPWTTVHDVYRSTDLSAIVQEVVNRAGWEAGNALAIFVTGSGRRTAESYNGAAELAPRLHVSYASGK